MTDAASNTALPIDVTRSLSDDGKNYSEHTLAAERTGSEWLLFADIFQPLQITDPLAVTASSGSTSQNPDHISGATSESNAITARALAAMRLTMGNLLPSVNHASGMLLPDAGLPPGAESTLATVTPQSMQTTLQVLLSKASTLAASPIPTTLESNAIAGIQSAADDFPILPLQAALNTNSSGTVDQSRLAWLAGLSLSSKASMQNVMTSPDSMWSVTSAIAEPTNLLPATDNLITNTQSTRPETNINVSTYLRSLQQAQSLLGESSDFTSDEIEDASFKDLLIGNWRDIPVVDLAEPHLMRHNPHANVAIDLHAKMSDNEIMLNTAQRPVFDLSMNHPDWEQQLGQRLLWMGNHQVQSASIRLNPPELGPVDIDLSIKENQININFITQGPQAKEALDFALPKLREIFLDSGFNAVNVDISSQQQGSHKQNHHNNYEISMLASREYSYKKHAVEATAGHMQIRPMMPDNGKIDLYT